MARTVVAMRFLCFHGKGTSSQLLEMQTERIRQVLDREHEFVFANGTIITEPAPGAEDVTDEHYRYVNEDVEQCRELLEDLKDLVVAQGPFDGLLGFSEGGGVAAFLLLEDAKRPFGNFKCAVFFSSAAPFDPDMLANEGEVRWVSAETVGTLINIPTAHMWSQVDDVSEKSASCVADLCALHVRETFIHGLGHDVPGAKGSEGLDETIRAVDRTIERARG